MVRYFFDVYDDDVLHPDTEGTELDDVMAAGIEGVQALAEMARDMIPGTTGKHLTMLVRDGEGRQTFELDLVFRMRSTIKPD